MNSIFMHKLLRTSNGVSTDNDIHSDNNNTYIVSQSNDISVSVERSHSNGNAQYEYSNGNDGKENIYHNNISVKTTNSGTEIEKNGMKSKSNGSLTRHMTPINNECEVRKKKWPTGKSYYIAKEILMTERTYKKDLDVITMWFRERRALDDSELSPFEDEPHLATLSALSEALSAHHGALLQDVEQRLAQWEGRTQQASSHQHHRIGDLLLKHLIILQPLYEDYLESHHAVLQKLEEAFWSDAQFQHSYRDFEHQKVCYLPFTTFLLKPLQRILHYKLLVDRLVKLYPSGHMDRENCESLCSILSQTVKEIRNTLPISENYAQLCELQRDVVGFDRLVQEDRYLIRIGCLLKHSTRGGLQQRMFFLFSDIMLYASKHTLPQTFKVHGHVPLRALLLKDGDSPNSFVIFGGTRSITVSANNELEKSKWVSDITEAVQNAKEHGDSKANYLSLKSCSSSEEIMESCGLDVAVPNAPSQRNNTALHVCWHRAATITLKEQLLQAENQVSGYLLRKFKNSSGWQKLWVVFTSFCLYFYKTCQDEAPLASLPLLGYTISPPSEQDAINKEFVFKLTFKNHVYFFRAESDHTFSRWMEVIGSATNSPKLI